MFKNSNKGVSLYLALIIMFILIAIGLGVSLIIVSQMKMIREMGDSVVALYAADTGIERALYEKRTTGQNWQNWPGSDPVGGASYTVKYVGNGEAMWQSNGTYQGVKRAIEITHPTVFDFSITVSKSDLCIKIPGSDSTTVTTTRISGIDRPINFSLTSSPSLPSTVSYSFTPASCSSVNCSSTLQFTARGGAGEYSITIYGETDILTRTKDIFLDIRTTDCPV
jgi:hypothetical protein